jgi:HK97 gp10 family phage protein
MPDVRVVLDEAAIRGLAKDPSMGPLLLEAAMPELARARAQAPKHTGAGAASIHAEAVLDGPEWTARASWDQLHFYMRFHELGTRYLPARPFLVPAFEGK